VLLKIEILKYQNGINMEKNESKTRLEEKMIMFQHIDMPFICLKYINTPIKVGRKRLRLYLELIETWYPIYRKVDNETKAQFISEIFKCQCTTEQLDKLASFKQITKKKVITMNNENVKTISRLRWRSRDQIQKNNIHFQI
jgi:hypothetical protein